jgi:signal transduction histidine kinase
VRGMLKNYDPNQIVSLAHAGSLFQGTAHNINTPLTSILGRAEIVRLRLDRLKQSITDQELLHTLDTCRKDIGRIVENCNKVSTYVTNAAHRCSASIQSTVKPVNIACVLRDDLEFLMSDMEFKHNIEIKYQIETDIPAINGAPVHFSNSFYEILDNARNAMLETASKKISVTVQAENGFIVVSICDNGCGMNEQTRLGILRVFEQPPANNGNSMSGLAYTALLLQPYNPVFSIESRPGYTKVSISFPVL